MRQFLWQSDAWPNMQWDPGPLLHALGAARAAQGQVEGAASFLSPHERQAIEVQAIEDAAIETSEIEGESLNREAVRSSIVRRLGLDDPAAAGPRDPRADGIVAITVDARTNAGTELTRERLFEWHTRLFSPEAERVAVGRWRDDAAGPMQVVSGRIGNERVHFEAPPAPLLAAEMHRFLTWFNTPPAPDEDGIVRSARAHLWFVTIHPFEDGNGRIARAIGDLALARDNDRVAEYVSMSRQIRREQRDYYAALEGAQRGTGDVTRYLRWYTGCYERAAKHTLDTFNDALRATRFWALHQGAAISERQRGVLARYLGPFEGNLTAPKYAKLAKVSVDTAQRDIADLVDKNVLARAPGAARNTSYLLQGIEPPTLRRISGPSLSL